MFNRMHSSFMLAALAGATETQGADTDKGTVTALTTTFGGLYADGSGFAESPEGTFTWDANQRSTGSPIALANTLLTIPPTTLRALHGKDPERARKASLSLTDAQKWAVKIGVRSTAATVSQEQVTPDGGLIKAPFSVASIALGSTAIKRNKPISA